MAHAPNQILLRIGQRLYRGEEFTMDDYVHELWPLLTEPLRTTVESLKKEFSTD